MFAVARGEHEARSLAGRVEIALAGGDVAGAVELLANAPGMLLRAVDRLARSGAGDPLVSAVREAAPGASARVLLSLREHLLNRTAPGSVRVFVNQEGGSWATADERAPLPDTTRRALEQVLDEELARRLPPAQRLVVEPAMRALAVPLSDKKRPDGLGIMPRGSVLPVGEHVRFFVHWKQRQWRTDYDLSVLLLDDGFHYAGQVSWTNLKTLGAVHSGDVTEAPDGASEFIDLDLGRVSARYVVAQVNIYSGESFDRAEEAFFGFMQREAGQTGRPFEPRTVRAKSDLFGREHVALPMLFAHGDAGAWHALWLHINLAGRPRFNRIEGNRDTTSLLVRAIVERRYLTVAYLEGLLLRNGAVAGALDGAEPITYLGLERPEELPTGSEVFTPANLSELLNPA